MFKIVFNNYKLNILYKTNAKRKKKEKYFIRLNIIYNLNVNITSVSYIFNKANFSLILYFFNTIRLSLT